MYLANGSVQIVNGSVRILNFAGQLHQRRKSILPARKHGTCKRTRPYVIYILEGGPHLQKLIPVSTDCNHLCTLPADANPERSEKRDGMPANL
jgi:hypothetical protein